MIVLRFCVEKQRLKRIDVGNVVAMSRNELYAEFELDEAWKNTEPIVAQFNKDDIVIDVFVENRRCLIPWEVLQSKGTLSVCLFGGDLLTTQPVDINIISTGVIGGLVPTKASPSVYQYIVDTAEKLNSGDFKDVDINAKSVETKQLKSEQLAVDNINYAKGIKIKGDETKEGYPTVIDLGSETGIRILNNLEKNSDWFIRIGQGEDSKEIDYGIQFENTGEFIVKNGNDLIRLTQKAGVQNVIKGNETLAIVSDNGRIDFDNGGYAGITYTKSEWNENFKQLNILTEKGVNIQAKNNSYFQSGEKKLVLGNDFNNVEFRTDGVAKFKGTINGNVIQQNGTDINNIIENALVDAMAFNNGGVYERGVETETINFIRFNNDAVLLVGSGSTPDSPDYASYITKLYVASGITEIGETSGCDYLTDVVLSESVTTIGNYAFDCCYELANINIPNSINYIGINAFYNTNIKEINIPVGVNIINESCFGSCSKLEKVNLSEGVNVIDTDAFNGCLSLREINIPESVTTIEENAFNNCENLTTIIVNKPVDSIPNAPWGAENATVVWAADEQEK